MIAPRIRIPEMHIADRLPKKYSFSGSEIQQPTRLADRYVDALTIAKIQAWVPVGSQLFRSSSPKLCGQFKFAPFVAVWFHPCTTAATHRVVMITFSSLGCLQKPFFDSCSSAFVSDAVKFGTLCQTSGSRTTFPAYDRQN